ncbi:Spore germination protein B3 precursor [compost metagenome]
MVQNTVNKLQHELHADAVGFGENLHIQHPGVWRKVKDDWDETFSHLPVTYEVKLNIEEYGASGTTTE